MTLVCLYGLPGSGKTTLSNRIAEEISSTVFTFDLLPIESPSYADYRKKCEDEVKKHVEANDSTIRRDRLVLIIDDVCYLKSMRRPFRRLASRFGLNYVAIHLPTLLTDCLTRNAKRCPSQRVDEQTIQRIHDSLEISEDSLIYDGDFKKLIDYLNSLPILDKPLRSSSPNQIHEPCDADLISREVVARLQKSFQPFDGKLMSQLRKELVLEYKTRKITYEEAFDILCERYKAKVQRF